jgi:hypothetical protein
MRKLILALGFVVTSVTASPQVLNYLSMKQVQEYFNEEGVHRGDSTYAFMDSAGNIALYQFDKNKTCVTSFLRFNASQKESVRNWVKSNGTLLSPNRYLIKLTEYTDRFLIYEVQDLPDGIYVMITNL